MQIFIYCKITLHVSGVHRASVTDHTIWEASSLKRDNVWSRLRERSVPEAATTVSCTRDDGRDGRPKHVE